MASPHSNTDEEVASGGGPSAALLEISVTWVRPATPTTPAHADAAALAFLSSCDLVCRSYPYINRIFFYGSPAPVAAHPHCSSSADIARHVASLKESLSRALVAFYPLAGRFAHDPTTGRLSVSLDDDAAAAGVEFVEARVHGFPFASFKDRSFQHSDLFWKLARRTHLLRSDYLDQPILSVQVTQFPDDNAGFTIGVSMSHVVADAQSFYDFMTCWADTCRSVPMRCPPLHVRHSLSTDSLSENSYDRTLTYLRDRVKDIRIMSCAKKQEVADAASGVKDVITVQEYGEKLLSVLQRCREEEKLFSAMEEQQQKKDEKIIDGIVYDILPTVGSNYRNNNNNNDDDDDDDFVARTEAPIMEKQREHEDQREARKDLVQRVFSFDDGKLKRIKEMAAGRFYDDVEGGPLVRAYTRFESFCAHWWRALIKARRLPEEQTVCLLIPINCRQRFLNLPKGYFGNALDGALVKEVAGILCKAPLPEIAGKIHRAISCVTEDSFRDYILEAERRSNAIPHFDRTGLFHVVDSPKYPVYNADFGWGSPDAVRAEGFRFGAEVQILAGASGGYDMFCALDADSMSALMADPTFLMIDS